MTAALSQDLRERIAHAVAQGSSIRKAARRFAVSPSAAIKLMHRVRQTGSTAPAQIGGYNPPPLGKDTDWLRGAMGRKAGGTALRAQSEMDAAGLQGRRSAAPSRAP